jgi:UDP-glucose 4-epimerase
MMQVAVGRREHLEVYGDDYNTPDGGGVAIMFTCWM